MKTNYNLFVEAGKHFHQFKYSYPPYQDYKYCRTPLQVYCIKHEEHFTTDYAKHILQKRGCKKCGDERGSLKRKFSYEKFVIKSKEIHGNQFSYPVNQIYHNCFSKLNITCNTCKADIITNYANHIHSKVGCKKCSSEKNAIKRRHGYQKFVENALVIHRENFFYPVYQQYLNARTPLNVFCKKHQKYFSTTYMLHITAKRGCFICSNRAIANKRIHGYDLFVARAKEIHGDKYGYFSDQVYKNNLTKFPVFCKKHDKIFQTSYSLHVYEKCGCPDCGRKRSKGENLIKNFLIQNNIEFIEQYNPEGLKDKRKLYIDFYLPTVRLLVEFQGEQHFRPTINFGGVTTLIPQLKRDQIKRKYAYDNKYEFLTIEKYQLKDLELLFGKYFNEKFFPNKSDSNI